MQRRILFFAFIFAAYLFYKFLNKKSEEEVASKMDDAQIQSIYYGVNGGSPAILQMIEEVASNFTLGANKQNLKALLFEITAVESGFGTSIDNTLTSGEGLTQFDRITFDEIKSFMIRRGVTAYNIQNTAYEALRTNPRLSLLMTRYFFYARVSSPIPSDIQGRAAQWKEYYNTYFGAGTEAAYIREATHWYNKLGVNFG